MDFLFTAGKALHDIYSPIIPLGFHIHIENWSVITTCKQFQELPTPFLNMHFSRNIYVLLNLSNTSILIATCLPRGTNLESQWMKPARSSQPSTMQC